VQRAEKEKKQATILKKRFAQILARLDQEAMAWGVSSIDQSRCASHLSKLVQPISGYLRLGYGKL